MSLLQQTAKSIDYDIKRFNIKDRVSLFQVMNRSTKVLLPELVKLMKLLLVMPATNGISERSFSVLKRVKTMRSTTTDNRLNHLMTLHIHKENTDMLDLIEVANEFCERNERRIAKVGKC